MSFSKVKEALASQVPPSQRGILIPRIDAYLREREGDARRKGYHPSSISYMFCPRLYAYLELDWVEGIKDVPPTLARIFDTGHSMHDRFHGYVRGAGVVLQHRALGNPTRDYFCEEYRLDHPVGLTGNADAMLDMDDNWWVVDFKSINPKRFATLYEPLDYHVKQLVIYMALTEYKLSQAGLQADKPIKGLMLYEDKAQQTLKEFQVEYGAAERMAFTKLLMMLKGVNEARETGDVTHAPCSCGKHEGPKWDPEYIRGLYEKGTPRQVKL